MGLSKAEWEKVLERERRNALRLEKLREQWNRKQVIQPMAKPDIPRPAVLLENDRIRLVYSYRTGTVATILKCLDGTRIVRRLEKFDEKEVGRALLLIQNPARRWPDGTLRGLKRLMVDAHGRYVSPTMAVVWKDNEMSETDWPNNPGEELRGKVGIHATWPDKAEELAGYPGALVEIAGYGRCVIGDLGWRSEFARVVRRVL